MQRPKSSYLFVAATQVVRLTSRCKPSRRQTHLTQQQKLPRSSYKYLVRSPIHLLTDGCGTLVFSTSPQCAERIVHPSNKRLLSQRSQISLPSILNNQKRSHSYSNRLPKLEGDSTVFSSPPSSPEPTGNQKLISTTKYLPQGIRKGGTEIGAVPPPTIQATEEAQSNVIEIYGKYKEINVNNSNIHQWNSANFHWVNRTVIHYPEKSSQFLRGHLKSGFFLQ
ncbi:hypothetical protein TNCV_2003551 [Trichonephila clavipes]|nr:hypothetical protein TNCV_2003551 [Trichonephila clavipes]